MIKKNTRKGTQTSSFGSPGRISHDATIFYNSKLYEGQPKEQKSEFIEQCIPAHLLDQIFCRTAEEMVELPDNSVHLMVTSPPYNVGKDYDENFTLREYLDFLKRVWQEVLRVLVPGGRACVNLANLGRKPYIPLHVFVIEDLLNLGFLMRGEIIWNKASSSSPSTAWGSWRSAANPTLRDTHEYILVFSKNRFGRQKNAARPDTISKEEFLEFSKSVWTFGAAPAKNIGHPAPFPMELPYRLIQLYTFQGDVVLDPFMGSGQTALAAIKTGRHFVGYEIDAEYVKLATGRIQDFRSEQNVQQNK
ncbi:MAG: site-specific DNA-methyltransferase [candidate division KSB1 bacterium]|nr:site-specific DNA-methyltransferase [candidate division KSB1 bacterium]MDZ7341765.1 site-specific DNA-methyltransferase [candidate division KSB1 bacterium]